MVRGKRAYNIAVIRPFLLLVVIPLVCVLGLDAETSPLRLPVSACKNGTATAAMPLIAGATYAWTVDGGTIIAGAGTERITMRFGSSDVARVSVTVSYGILTHTAS